MLKKIIAGLFLFLCLYPQVKAQDKSVGVALKGGITGVGGDIVLKFHDRMSARLGFDQMKLGYDFSFEESDISYDATANVKTGTLLALYDFYLTDYIFLSGGFGLNNFNVNASGKPNKDLPWGDISIPADRIGTFEFDIKPSMRISPYLGIGFGRTLGKTKNLSAAFEIGTFYQGSPNVTINSTGLLAPTSDPDRDQEAVIENQLSQYYLYPVIKLSISYKIYNF